MRYRCVCGAMCSTYDNLLAHVRAIALGSDRRKFREMHVNFAAAMPTLFPDTLNEPRIVNSHG